MGGFFSFLLGREKLFGIGRRKPTELSAIATGAIQDCHFQTLKRKLLVSDLLKGGLANGKSSLEFRGLRQAFLLEQGLHRLGLAPDDSKSTFIDDAAVEGNSIHLVGLAVVPDLHH